MTGDTKRTVQDGTFTLRDIKSSSFSPRRITQQVLKVRVILHHKNVVNSTYFNKRAYLNKGKNKKEGRFLPPHAIYSDALKSQ